MNIILLRPEEVSSDRLAVLADARAEHLRTVLKVAPGQLVRAGLLNGPRGQARVVAACRTGVTLEFAPGPDTPIRPCVDLLLALPRPKVMKRLWAQLAAIGIGQIILTNAWKVERCYFDSHVISPEFYEPLLIEGLQQAGDTMLPQVSIHRQFKPLVDSDLPNLFPAGLRLVAVPGAPSGIHAAVAAAKPLRVLIAIGPEGGWTPFELEWLQAHGFAACSAGPRILRTDTACLALLALAHDALNSTT